jgi:putative transposase
MTLAYTTELTSEQYELLYTLLVEWVRGIENRHSSPSAASMDSQTVPTSVMVNQSVGYDAPQEAQGTKTFDSG